MSQVPGLGHVTSYRHSTLFHYIYTHHFGKAEKKKDCRASLIREEFQGTNKTLSFFSYLSYLTYLLNADLAQPELRA